MLLASPDSPLGAALMGASEGDTVTYEAPGGTFSYTVKAVRVYED
ncbi:MAG: GreA/GreB family elongation factor [Acidimicrobiia bacterium]